MKTTKLSPSQKKYAAAIAEIEAYAATLKQAGKSAMEVNVALDVAIFRS